MDTKQQSGLGMITKTKHTKQHILQANTICLLTLTYQNIHIMEIFETLCCKGIIGSNANMKGLGSPDYRLKETENNQGVWTFRGSRGTNFIIFSDGYKKDAYKGTSIEIETNYTSLDDVAHDIFYMIKHMCDTSNYYGYNEEATIKSKEFFSTYQPCD